MYTSTPKRTTKSSLFDICILPQALYDLLFEVCAILMYSLPHLSQQYTVSQGVSWCYSGLGGHSLPRLRLWTEMQKHTTVWPMFVEIYFWSGKTFAIFYAIFVIKSVLLNCLCFFWVNPQCFKIPLYCMLANHVSQHIWHIGLLFVLLKSWLGKKNPIIKIHKQPSTPQNTNII